MLRFFHPVQICRFSSSLQSMSPDHQIEELLKKDENGADELSEKYLRINGRYITDGQVLFRLRFFCLVSVKSVPSGCC